MLSHINKANLLTLKGSMYQILSSNDLNDNPGVLLCDLNYWL